MQELDIGYNDARQQFNILINEFNMCNRTKEKNFQPISNRYNNKNYPAEYGGAYFDKNVGKLVVCMTKATDYNYCSELLNSDVVVYKQVDNSYNELLENLQKITDIMPEFGISAASISQRENKLFISFSTDDKKIAFQKFCEDLGIDKKTYVIEENTQMVEPLSFIQAGKAAQNTNNEGCTIGFNAYRTSIGKTTYGVVTAGHAYPGHDAGLYNDSLEYIGLMKNENLYLGGYRDAIFVPFSGSKWSPTQAYYDSTQKIVMGKITETQYITDTMEGDLVIKYGKVKGRTSGNILSASCSATFKDANFGQITLTDQFSTDCVSDHGDSGGPIGIETGSIGNKSMSLLGIVSTGVQLDNSVYWAIGCKMTNLFGTVAFPY